jgi:pimeloyl-ACP methyl ester carboxylesterase
MWDVEIETVGGETEILAPHLPGFGGTPLPDGALTVEVMADHVARSMDEAGIDRAVICGCSMGGYAAFEMWRSHRDRVAGLCLVDTRAEPDDEAGRQRRRELAEAVREQGSEIVADSPPPLLSEGASDELWGRVREIIRRQPAEAIARASLGMADRPDSGPILGEIEVPTTVVVGSGDRLTPPPFSERMAAAIPGAELVVLEGAGHLANLEAPGEFLAALGALLERAT